MDLIKPARSVIGELKQGYFSFTYPPPNLEVLNQTIAQKDSGWSPNAAGSYQHSIEFFHDRIDTLNVLTRRQVLGTIVHFVCPLSIPLFDFRRKDYVPIIDDFVILVHHQVNVSIIIVIAGLHVLCRPASL